MTRANWKTNEISEIRPGLWSEREDGASRRSRSRKDGGKARPRQEQLLREQTTSDVDRYTSLVMMHRLSLTRLFRVIIHDEINEKHSHLFSVLH